VTLNETSAGDAIPHIPSPPNRGCVAYVLRTGFASSQGSLMQMIEFSQQSVHGDVRETGIALLILVLFALISAAYVMKVGLEKKEKTTHELLLKCVMIITSVIPQQFPMQMAVAVNVALMALMKVVISCALYCMQLIHLRLVLCVSSLFAYLSLAKSLTAFSTKRALSLLTNLCLTAL
jgi:cation-transporting ATPase 13A1